MKTTQDIEDYIPQINKLIGIKDDKWVTLRFIINISLSFNNKIFFDENPNFDGKNYKLEQITGLGKEYDDYTDLYLNMIEIFDKKIIKNHKELNDKLQYHLLRGYKILNSSLNLNSNLYEFLLQEFF